MASTRNLVLFFTVTLFLRISVDAEFMKPHDLLKDNFYKDSCPNAEAVIRRAVFTAAEKNLKLAAGLIRLQFHDCFVEGCDGSVLLDGNDTEKTAPVNEHLKGFRVVDAAKAAVEEVCPGVVSCADVLAYAARDSTVMLNGTRFEVQGGRKDGLFSCAEAAERDLPPPTFNASQLIDSFAKRGLSAEQMVVLSGSHTVGVGHCDKFIERLYNFSEAHATDPSLNSTYAKQLKRDCPKRNFNSTLEIFMDTMTPGEIDSNYYVGLTQRKGLFTSDQTLFEDRRTRKFVRRLMNEGRFDRRFGEAMRAMGAVGVQFEGQIRKNCRKVNEE
ncbi:peroxidase [Marchantia polymorpha subsp. ruderalis]|uniref:Peroxidase n=2 Tax=Marchantia polymorpha TaxID=3197 RepID=A0A176VN69_MARPO|nr:hypothetical protein AXG93_3833s1140 [Marchantia polymorpha subsp. ruderalis]PTQ35592.1 hypothetical protein MARPO_0070s0055 [Marchantia polymorpha]BBN08761.1 hypothetical protein Mp_4g14270 [Marchantia polymorpha subsp. ruderalis]|eukprot:PTQ35592.1 hypothetical protein MARPO_0070s0055 [Marchantia polymorpha]